MDRAIKNVSSDFVKTVKFYYIIKNCLPSEPTTERQIARIIAITITLFLPSGADGVPSILVKDF